ncbi:MAG: hypothetical protein HOJ35_04950 [Bdellovibrionales bacterium]|jgi:hypothetical protein|nr:hypothetical protein [Bdellovibrionales bacterium]
MNKGSEQLKNSIIEIEKKIKQGQSLNESELLDMFLATIIKRVKQND